MLPYPPLPPPQAETITAVKTRNVLKCRLLSRAGTLSYSLGKISDGESRREGTACIFFMCI